MKKMIKIILAAALLSCGFGGKNVLLNDNLLKNEGYEAISVSAATNIDLQTHAKSAYLMDYHTQTVVYAHQEDKRLPIASMCKIMTLLLSFEAIILSFYFLDFITFKQK